MRDSEIVLLNRYVAGGDAGAISEIIQRHAGLVYNACLRVLGDKDKAADAAQETFFQFVQRARDITGSIPGWLHRVAVRKSIDLVRSESSRKRCEQRYADAKQGESATWHEMSCHVDAALDRLDDQTRDLLIRHFFERTSMTDLARQRGVSRMTVARRIDAGIGRLRSQLRRRGILVAGAGVGTMLSENAAQAAPPLLMKELAKMAMLGPQAVGAGTAGVGSTSPAVGVGAGTVFALTKTQIVTVAAVVAIGAGGIWLSRRAFRPSGPASPGVLISDRRTDEPVGGTGTSVSQDQLSGQPQTETSAGRSEAETRPATETSGTGGETDAAIAPAPQQGDSVGQSVIDLSTPEAAVSTFARLLEAGDLTEIKQCFVANAPDYEDLCRIAGTPDDELDARLEQSRQCFRSIGTPVEIVDIVEAEYGGLDVTWTFTVKQAFTWTAGPEQEGQTWQAGDVFEFDGHMVQQDDKWLFTGM